MSLAQSTQPGGAGGGTGTGLATATAAVLIGRTRCKDVQSSQVAIRVAATGAFKLDYMFTPDAGVNWYVGKTVSSSTVVVNGGTGLYVQSAEMVIEVGYEFKFQIYQSTGGDIDFAYDYRPFCTGGQ